MENNIFAEIKQEGTSLEDMLQESAPESQPEKEPEDVIEPTEPVAGDIPTEEPLAFHKHPRWIERENELRELREREEENSREIAELRLQDSQRVDPAQHEIPDWFTELYGDNQTAWDKYQKHEDAQMLAVENRILERQQKQREDAQKRNDYWDNWTEKQVAEVKADGHTFDENKLKMIMLDYSPTDENNNLSYKKGMAIYKALEGNNTDSTQRSDARKQLADTATKTGTRGEAPKKDYKTSEDLRFKTWEELST